MDTVFALGSASGKAGVAVIRVSGPKAHDAARAFESLPNDQRPALRHLTYQGEVLDSALILRFDAPASFTGEDVVEFHCHGSPAIVSAVLAALSSMDGLRQAEAGEFTRRALENDRLDLAQVEGLSDLIEAETEAQRRQAMQVFRGALGAKTDIWRSDLIRAAALLEATIDFADEDVPVDVYPEVKTLLSSTLTSVLSERDGVQVAERIRDGFEVAIIGPPNAGKSTLLNALAGRDAAITSDVAGTTRDIIEVRMSLAGLPVTLLDTAGLRESDDHVEVLGIERARQRADDADLRVILVLDGEAPILEPRADDIVLSAKDDAGENGGVSGKTGAGVDALVSAVGDILGKRAVGAGVAIRERHKVAMDRAAISLGIAHDRIETAPEYAELIAEEIRDAIRALDSLVGRVDVEDLLDEIFTSFCIGK